MAGGITWPGSPTKDKLAAKEEGMKSLLSAVLSVSIFLVARGVAPGQTPPPTVDGYITAAKVAAGTDWAGTFLPHVHSAATRHRRTPASKPNHTSPRNMVRGTGEGR